MDSIKFLLDIRYLIDFISIILLTTAIVQCSRDRQLQKKSLQLNDRPQQDASERKKTGTAHRKSSQVEDARQTSVVAEQKEQVEKEELIETRMWHDKDFKRFVEAKCALKTSILFMFDILFPLNYRFGSKEARDAFHELENMSSWDAIHTVKGWKLMNKVYGNDWNDGQGRDPTQVMKRLLNQVVGLETRQQFFQFIWSASWIDIVSKCSIIKKKRFLIFGYGAPGKIPFIISGSQGTDYYLFGVAEKSMVKTEEGWIPHTFWTYFYHERPWTDDPTKITGWKTDVTFEKVVCSLDPAPEAYAYVYRSMDPPTLSNQVTPLIGGHLIRQG